MKNIIKATFVLSMVLFAVVAINYSTTGNVFAWDANAGNGCCDGSSAGGDGGNQGGGETLLTPVCTISATPKAIVAGEAVTLAWTTGYANTANIAGIGSVSVGSGSKVVYPTTNTTYTMSVSRLPKTTSCAVTVRVEQPKPEVIAGCTDEQAINFNEKATEDDGSCEYEEVEIPGCIDADAINYNAEATVNNGSCEYPEPPVEGECKLSVDKWVSDETATPGDELTYTIKVYNFGTADCTGGGVMVRDHLPKKFVYTSYELDGDISAGYDTHGVYDAEAHSLYFNAHTLVPKEGVQVKVHGHIAEVTTCEDFVMENQAKATARELNNFTEWSYSDIAKTAVNVDCEKPEEPIYGCTDPDAINYNEEATKSNDSCEYEHETPAPVCESFTASASHVASTGGNVTLTWNTSQASTVTIYPTLEKLGTVAVDGTESVFVSASTKFLLTATNEAGDEVTCDTTVLVDPAPEVFTCANNVLFTASKNSITKGNSTTLNWTVTGADSATVSGVNATTLTGSQSVSPSTDTTYTVTAKKGEQTISCPLTIDVSSNSSSGGGGGTATVRCELDASATKISSGDDVRLTWDTSGASEVTLKDDAGKVIFTTEDYLNADKRAYFDYSLKVSPKKDTTYTLTAERGSRDRDCKVSIDVTDDIVVLETRDQQPLVAGIALTQVPYTGFEAGSFAAFLFYTLLVLWALYITYILVIRKEEAPVVATVSPTVTAMRQAEAIRPDLFPTIGGTAPANLPTTQKKSHLTW